MDRKEKKQVSESHYNFNSYVDKNRWNSYYCQIEEVMKSRNIKHVLIIGTGDGIVPEILRMIDDTAVIETFDIDPALKPDICGDIEELSTVITRKYDVLVCCQVCEHLKFEKFEKILAQIKCSVSRGGVIILSLPIRYVPVTVWIDFPKIHIHIKKYVEKFWENDFLFDGQHYWEMGVRKYSKRIVRSKIKKFFKISREYHVECNPYHYFYICRNN